MRKLTKYAAGAASIGLAAAAGVSGISSAAVADSHGTFWAGLAPAANQRLGIQDNRLATGLAENPVAWGALPLTNPDTTGGITNYGYNTSNLGPLTQNAHEAFKTEPDKNAYLVMGGHHYVYQGHEGAPRGYVTRIDLDQATPAQKVSLIADKDAAGNPLPSFDGITWNPFTHQLLLTAEAKYPAGGVWAVTLDANGDATTGVAVRVAALGAGGYEGIQNDSEGNIWLVEDVGGAAAGANLKGKVPNSYVYRFRPTDKTNLAAGGTFEALRVYRDGGAPVTAAELAANPADPFVTDLHTYGKSFNTDWVTIHSGPAGTDPAGFDATAGAAAAGATPFKRPENGVFRPGTHFGEFYFTETGDTNAISPLPGAFGGVFVIKQSGPNATTGKLSPVSLGDVEHTGYDNIQFATANDLLVVEDAGDALHQQRNALDSAYSINLRTPRTPTRILAEGRDSSATYDALTSPGYNDGDNEVTGMHVSNGDPSTAGILGAQIPTPFADGWRVFWTQQHGDNVTWEITSAASMRG
ncbi:MAG: hypothetical protein QOG52_1714 [Frankiaceae bacterium]|jgi:hypothetical protein|nr:hypothetical protein [Frankiaceae bacterium]